MNRRLSRAASSNSTDAVASIVATALCSTFGRSFLSRSAGLRFSNPQRTACRRAELSTRCR